jgi:phospholipid-transporting ATPase
MHSGIIYGLMMVFYGTEMIDSSNGTTTGLYFWGLISYTCVLMTVLGKASLIIEYWNKYSFIGIFGSVGLYVLFLAVYCNVRLGIGYEVAYYFVPLFSSSRFWLALIFIPVVTLLRDISWK